MAGIAFNPTQMSAGFGNTQQYALFGELVIPPQHFYNSPNLFSGHDFSDIYLGRIYSSAWGWSQYTTKSGQNTVWATAMNTSVWDTLAAAATIDTAGSKAIALRIHPGARLRVRTGRDLTCTGVTEINEAQGLWIASDATGTGSFIDNGTISYNSPGTARADRYFSQGMWHYWSMPVNGSSAAPFAGLYVRWYDEPSHLFLQITSGGYNLAPTAGYIVWSAGANTTRGVSGFFNTGLVATPTLTSTLVSPAVYDGYNLIGNPYPSSLDWAAAGWDRINVEPVKYSFNINQYQTYNAVTGESTNGGDQFIRPEQGFFVHVTDNTSGMVTFSSATRLHTTGSYNKRSGGLSDQLILTATANGIEDEAHIVFNKSATPNFDPDYDAYKMTGSSQAPNLYSRLPGGIMAAVNWLPRTGSGQVIPVGFTCGLSGIYFLTASNLSSFNTPTQIFLEDIKENTIQNLATNPVHHFTYSAGEAPIRFLLHFSAAILGLGEAAGESIAVYSFGELVYVKILTPGEIRGNLRIYDLSGRQVFGGLLQNLSLNRFRPLIPGGLYLVKIETGSTVISKKVFIGER